MLASGSWLIRLEAAAFLFRVSCELRHYEVQLMIYSVRVCELIWCFGIVC